MTETPQDMAARLMQEIEEGTRTSFSKGQLRAILNQIAQNTSGAMTDTGCRAPATIKELRRGDVFIGKMVGGKLRPWVVLRVDGKTVTAVGMSSGDSAPNMIHSKCRLWPGNWIGSTISQFRLEDALKEVTRPYTNWKHLREIEAAIATNMGMTLAPAPPITIAQIAKRVGGKA